MWEGDNNAGKKRAKIEELEIVKNEVKRHKEFKKTGEIEDLVLGREPGLLETEHPNFKITMKRKARRHKKQWQEIIGTV